MTPTYTAKLAACTRMLLKALRGDMDAVETVFTLTNGPPPGLIAEKAVRLVRRCRARITRLAKA